MRAPVQLDLFDGEALAIAGAATAASHADANSPGWSDEARKAAREFVFTVAPTLSGPFESFAIRRYAEESLGVESPPDSRAWGHIVRALKKEGLIEADSVGRSSDPRQHRGFATLWRPVPAFGGSQ